MCYRRLTNIFSDHYLLISHFFRRLYVTSLASLTSLYCGESSRSKRSCDSSNATLIADCVTFETTPEDITSCTATVDERLRPTMSPETERNEDKKSVKLLYIDNSVRNVYDNHTILAQFKHRSANRNLILLSTVARVPDYLDSETRYCNDVIVSLRFG